MLTLNPALIYWHFSWLQQDRLREAEAARLVTLARQFTTAWPTASPQPKREVEPCTVS